MQTLHNQSFVNNGDRNKTSSPQQLFTSVPLIHFLSPTPLTHQTQITTKKEAKPTNNTQEPSVRTIVDTISPCYPSGKVCQRKTTAKYNGRVFVEADVIIEIFNHTLTFTTP